jgi:hypothetical protein
VSGKITTVCCILSICDLGLRLPDYNAAFVPYYVADEVVTMDALWCQEESVIQGNVFLVGSQHTFIHLNAENLA